VASEIAVSPVGVSSVMTSQISAAHLMSCSSNGKASFGNLPSVVALIKIAPGLVDFETITFGQNCANKVFTDLA